ncbi:Ig-like domain-containing protein [Bordetella sputigena]|uniref:hypothetical protein n=1 Tax=Bordetella sputigena TaxID=1416810 RepID=UPI0039F0CA2E
MADSIMPPSGSPMGIRAKMHFVFTYDPPSPTDPKDIPVTFKSSDGNVEFDEVMPITTDSVTGMASATLTYTAQTDGVSVPLEVVNPGTGAPYITATYTTSFVNIGKLVVSPDAVPVAPDSAGLGEAAYTLTVTAQPTGRGNTLLKNYPVGIEVVGNVHVYRKSGTTLIEVVVSPDGLYWFNLGPLGEAVEIKMSALYEGIYTCAIKYGSNFSADNDHVIFLPELVGGGEPQFDLWSPINLDAFSGPQISTTIVGSLNDENTRKSWPTVALVNGKVASAVDSYEALAQGFNIQKQAFVQASDYVINWMATQPGGALETIQSGTVSAEVKGDTWLHPPLDGKLARPFTIGLSTINTGVLLKGDISVYVPDLKLNDEITLVVFLNAWDPLNPGAAKAASLTYPYKATQDGTNTVPVSAHDLGGYAPNGLEPGTFEAYYYKGQADPPTDDTQYSAPLSPALKLATG